MNREEYSFFLAASVPFYISFMVYAYCQMGTTYLMMENNDASLPQYLNIQQ